MIAVDTNVVVRFLTADDPAQARKIWALFRDNEVWLSRTVILETEWVLRGAFDLNREAVNKALISLISMEGVEVEDHPMIEEALRLHELDWDFADALHVLACPSETKTFFSFDKRLVKKKIASLKLQSP
jgi:predicted nucleic-acid-binding protein